MNTDSAIAIKLDIPNFLFPEIIDRPQLFYDLLMPQQLDDLKGFLFDLLQDKDGSPEFDDFEVHAVKFDSSTQEGSFRLKFTINRRFCCADTSACQMDYLDFNFSYVKECVVARANYFNWNLDN